jgi:hypothetical protein
MLLIMFMGLIAKLALVSGDCNVGTEGLNDFDFNRVGIDVSIWFLKQYTFNTLVCVYISFVFPLTKYQ